MKTYNKIMQIFWLVVGVLVTIIVTYKGFVEGFNRWAFYYIFALLAFFVYFIRWYMMKRMAKHNETMKKNKDQKRGF